MTGVGRVDLYRESLLEDIPCLVFHASPMFRRPKSEAAFKVVIQFADRDTSHVRPQPLPSSLAGLVVHARGDA